MNHNEGTNPYAVLERRHRVQVIDGLRANGLTYTEIRELLGVTLRQIETVLGEAEVLRAKGFRTKEIAAEIGVPPGSLGRVLASRRRGTLTARQDEAVSAIVHMRGMQVDVLAEYLNVLESSAYALLRELIAKGLVCELKKVQRGRAWAYVPPKVEHRYLGWRTKDWSPPLKFAEHYRAVAQARIMLVGSDPRAFISERVLRQAAARAAQIAAEKRHGTPVLEFSSSLEPMPGRPHIHDGRFLGVVRGTYGWWALEVELSVKDNAYMDIALQGAIRAAADAHPYTMVGLLYLCRSKAVKDNVEAASERLPADLQELPLDLEIQDFDKRWAEFVKNRMEARAAAREAKRLRRNLIDITQEAS
ncbi:hypothetical protein H0264_18550 [Nocardia huaxiensis]|uniref:Uncharacterized protein n=1 Tax=Nocardia huaxiensis TaxID=2755382 RepID=A0A7D6VDL3_9NOCA|nr:hypothetical protein [Nocardia huaxiensis]QLY33961.1 hypothetical protein H0264_18550 [Nocardia huaxiensis]